MYTLVHLWLTDILKHSRFLLVSIALLLCIFKDAALQLVPCGETIPFISELFMA